MPTPHPDSETMREWMDRCIPQVIDDGTAQDADQAAAICASMWEDAKSMQKFNPHHEPAGSSAGGEFASGGGSGSSGGGNGNGGSGDGSEHLSSAQDKADFGAVTDAQDEYGVYAYDLSADTGIEFGDDLQYRYDRDSEGVVSNIHEVMDDESTKPVTSQAVKDDIVTSERDNRAEEARGQASNYADDGKTEEAAALNAIADKLEGKGFIRRTQKRMKRAYSILTLKSIQKDARVITGLATTPTPDRIGDIIAPLGVKFRNPLPLLWQHRSDQPVGTVRFSKPTADGVAFTATLPKIEEPGPLQDRIDTAWGEIKAGLVRGVSIGFRSLEASIMDDGGILYSASEVLEMSLVTIPANAEATIQSIKSFDDIGSAASGNEADVVSSPASRESKPQPKAKEPRRMQTTQERTKAFEAKRQAKSARMTEIMAEAGDETLDASQSEEYDGLQDEVKQIDEHLVRLNACLKAEAVAAKPVAVATPEDTGQGRRPDAAPRVSIRDVSLPKGVGFGRLMRCKALAKLDGVPAYEVAKQLYPEHTELEAILKTAVAAGTTTVSGWASQLVNVSSIFADFVEYLRPLTILGQFGTNGVPALRRVPFRTILASQTAGTTGYWVGEGQPKPVSKPTFASTYLLPYKVAAISVATMELLRDSSPAVEGILRDDLAKAVAAKIDTDFLDPQKGADSVSPASISNGVTVINSSGRDADSVRADLVSALAAYVAANNLPTTGVWVMSAITALQLSLLTNALGQPEFPGIGMTGGRLQGLPVITSEFLGYTTDSPTEGRDVFLVNANDIWFADDGGIDVAMSSEAALEMLDNPTNASGPTTTATSMISMWQTNSVAFRAERTVSWGKRRAEAVQQIAQVEWGEASGVNV